MNPLWDGPLPDLRELGLYTLELVFWGKGGQHLALRAYSFPHAVVLIAAIVLG
jgi:hypothetical protein